MKKALSFVLVLCMLFSQLARVTFAAGIEDGTTFAKDELWNKFGDDMYYTNQKLSGTPHTFEAWVYFDSSSASANGVLMGNYDQASKYCLNFGVQAYHPRLNWTDDTGNAHNVRFDTVSVQTGEWAHMVIVNDPSTHEMRCYLNGELAETKYYYPDIDPQVVEQFFVIGGDLRRLNTDYFKGGLKGLTVYSDVRTAEEIAAAAAGTAADVTDPNLLADWDFSAENAKTNIKDNSLNGVDLTYSNMWLEKSEVDALFADEDFDRAYSFAVVGDTQMVAAHAKEGEFNKIYQWILDNQTAENIQYCIGLGDITDDNGKDPLDSEVPEINQWTVAAEGIKLMDGKLPYSLIRGNHDISGTNYFDQYFATDPDYADQFSGNTGGVYEEGSMFNTYRLFSPEGSDVNWLILNLDYCPEDGVVEWANEVVASHPDHQVIITTHAYSNADGRHYDMADVTAGSLKTMVDQPNTGDLLWEKLVSKHTNISMVLCGHIYSDHIKVTQRQGDGGNTVTEMLINPQGPDRTLTGDGYNNTGVGAVALFHFNKEGTQLQVEYYSTIQERYWKTNSQLTIDLTAEAEPLDLTGWYGQEEEPSGTGTYEDPYLVEHAGHLYWMSGQITTGTGASFKGQYFKQTQDIDLKGLSIPSIGYYYSSDSALAAFSGYYDGQGFKIHNGTIQANSAATAASTTNAYPDRQYGYGLFGVLYGGTVQNVHLDDMVIEGYGTTGAIVGKAAGPSSGSSSADFNTISNCSVSESCEIVASFNGLSLNAGLAYDNLYHAGVLGSIVGVARSATINYCTSAMDLKVPGSFGVGGGIAGTAGYHVIIDHCAFTGSLTLIDADATITSSFGGILGITSPNTATTDVADALSGTIKITNCYNTGALRYAGDPAFAKNTHWGGIIGFAGRLPSIDAKAEGEYSYYMENCHNLHAIDVDSSMDASTTGDWAGGLVGKAQMASGSETEVPLWIKDCTSVAITTVAETEPGGTTYYTNEYRAQRKNSNDQYGVMEINASATTEDAATVLNSVNLINEEISVYQPTDTYILPSVVKATAASAADSIAQTYSVSTVEELVWASQHHTFFGTSGGVLDTILLTADLDISKYDGSHFSDDLFLGIDTSAFTGTFATDFTGFSGATVSQASAGYFYGNFNGNGHTISNYADSHGLFVSGLSGTISNLTLDTAAVTGVDGTYNTLLSRTTPNFMSFDNVHIVNSTLTSDKSNYNGFFFCLANHQAARTVSITNCSLVGSTLNLPDSTAYSGLIGGSYTSSPVFTMKNCIIADNTMNNSTAATAQLLIGTINRNNISGVTFKDLAVYGNTAANTTALAYINAVATNAPIAMENIFSADNSDTIHTLLYTPQTLLTTYAPSCTFTNVVSDTFSYHLYVADDNTYNVSATATTDYAAAQAVSDLNTGLTGNYWYRTGAKQVTPLGQKVTFTKDGNEMPFYTDRLTQTLSFNSAAQAISTDALAALKAEKWYLASLPVITEEDIHPANTSWETMQFAEDTSYLGISTNGGDVNGDGVTNVVDVLIALRLLNLKTYSGANFNAASLFVDGDNLFSTADAVILLRVAAGWEEEIIPPPANAIIQRDPATKLYSYTVEE